MKTLALPLVLLVPLHALAGEALPPAAAAAVVKYEASVEQARREFELKEIEARLQLLEQLQKAAEAEGKRGNLDGAIAVKKKIESYPSPKANPPGPGRYEDKHGIWTVSIGADGKMALRYSKKPNRNTDARSWGNAIAFNWTDNDGEDLIVLERTGPDAYTLAQYTRGAPGGIIPASPALNKAPILWKNEAKLLPKAEGK